MIIFTDSLRYNIENMNHENTVLLNRFYSALQQKDILAVQDCYHPDAIFNDPVFQNLNCKQVQAMWGMLLTRGKDMVIQYHEVKTDDLLGSAKWDAVYTFSKTQKRVHNFIESSFEFKDQKIYRHIDSFSFPKWAAQALGLPGVMLGWTDFLHNKVRKEAARNLKDYMNVNV
jgi:hypothetical protein